MSTDKTRLERREKFGSHLKMLRERGDMTQEQLAALSGVDSVTIRNWENARVLPLAKKLQALSEAFVKQKVCETEKEVSDIWSLAREAGLRVALDENWLKELRRRYNLSAPEPPPAHKTPGTMKAVSFNASAQVSQPPVLGETRPVSGDSVALPSNGGQPRKVRITPRSQDQQRMLDNIDTIWVKGLLGAYLRDVVEIKLELHEKPDLVESPWRHYAYLLDDQRPTAKNTRKLHIVDAYKAAHNKLLILGEPGSGKTTLLLQLAKALIQAARDDPTQPIPVIFPLDSWVKKRQPIEQWLVEELGARYHILPALSEEWIEKDQILPLFDGLDEVDATSYSACIEALNVYLKKHGLVPTVICTRRSEYVEQQKRLLLHNAVLVQPLTEKLIDKQLQTVRKQKEDFHKVLLQDALLRTPLMLRMLTTVYENGEVGATETAGTQNVQRQIFDIYVLQMFKRRSPDLHYDVQQTFSYLRWLAQHLHKNNQKDFYIEFMQFDLLPASPWKRQMYPALAVGLMYGLLSAIGFGISYIPYFPVAQVLLFILLITLFNTFLYSVFNGIAFGGRRSGQTQASQSRGSGMRQKIARGGGRVVYGILNGVCIGLFVGWLVGPVSGEICGLFLCLFCAALGRMDTQIKCAEYLKWSTLSMVRNSYMYLAFGVFVGLLYGLVTGRDFLFVPTMLLPSLLLGTGIGLIVGLLMSIRGGFIYEEPDPKNIRKPNQGIRNSIRNSFFFGSFFGIIFGVIFWLIYGPVLFHILGDEYRSTFPANSGLIYGISDGVIIGAFFWLVSGGVACIQHTLLRIMLWRRGSIPRNYIHFLDHCVDLALLYKLGGGYIFFHSLLQEYFATLSDADVKKLLDRFHP